MEIQRQATKWADLSDRAKNLLEWSEDVYTGKKNVITIRINEKPTLSQSKGRAVREATSETVGRDLFEEIRYYIEHGDWVGQWKLVFDEISHDHMVVSSDMPAHTML